jgi:threonyl-tRNA synthetase
MQKNPFMLIVGEEEEKNGTISYVDMDRKEKVTLPLR